MIYIFWTSKDKQEAKRVIFGLLENRLIACASLFPVESIYRWEGKVEEGSEVKAMLKTEAAHFDAISVYIQNHGSYEVPEISQVDVSRCNPAYLSWLEKEIK